MQSRKRKDILSFAVICLVVVAINVLVSYEFFRIDLTKDKRYSISESSKEIIENLEYKLTVDVYLHGDFPARFKQLEFAINEKLEDLKAYGGVFLEYNFIDPFEIKDIKERKALLQKLAERGIQPVNLSANEDGKSVEKLIYPGAILKYRQRELAVNFLKGLLFDKADNRIAQSIENIEYELIHSIRTVTNERKKRIAFIDGHQELGLAQLHDAIMNLSLNYEVGQLNLSTIPKIENVDAIVIAQPKSEYSQADKFKIDQFIMNGGKALFFIDMLEVRRDTAGMQGLPYKLNLSDLLFKYGIRINQNLVQDLYGVEMPVRVGKQYMLKPWHFYPVLNRFNKDHPITHNLGPVLSKNIGTIDTTKAPGITKTPLIYTSQYVRVKGQPVVYSPEELRVNMDKNFYPSGNLPMAFLLEGKFTSLFKNRPVPQGADGNNFKANTDSGQVVVVSDGDIIANDIDERANKPYEMGYHRITRRKYDNKAFVLNTFDYLLEDEGVIDLKLNTYDLRPLDKFRIKDEKLFWQILNVVIPIIAVFIFGVLRFFLRRYRYTGN